MSGTNYVLASNPSSDFFFWENKNPSSDYEINVIQSGGLDVDYMEKTL